MRGQDDDRELALLAPQRAGDVATVDSWKTDVEDQQIGGAARIAQCSLSIADTDHGEPLTFEMMGD